MQRDARQFGDGQHSGGEKPFRAGELVPRTSYRVTRCIGTGGMGSVYEVEHVELGRRFVLKALLRELAQRRDLVLRLRNEWRALGRLEHANIVTVTDAGISGDGLPYYVMERLAGETLAHKLKRETVLAVPEALELTLQLLSGLGAAHQIGIVHRDIKPSNLFLSEDGPLKLLDFGIAKLEDGNSKSITAKGIAIGTPRYMAPEQARGDDVDGRADLYAVGLILFEMVSGRGPFDHANSANSLLLAQIHQAAPPLSEILPGVASELSEIVERLLAKDPRERPASVRDVVRALEPLSERYASIVSTSQVTREASYDLSRISEESLAGTRPDGVAARKPTALGLGRAPHSAQLLSDDTQTEKGMLWTPLGETGAPSTTTLDAPGAGENTSTRPSFDDVDPETVPDPRLADARSSASAAGPAGGKAVQRDDVPTRTSVPASQPSPGPHPSSTPPPVERGPRSGSVPAERLRRRARLAWGLFAVGTSTCLVAVLLQGSRLWTHSAGAQRADTLQAAEPAALDLPPGARAATESPMPEPRVRAADAPPPTERETRDPEPLPGEAKPAGDRLPASRHVGGQGDAAASSLASPSAPPSAVRPSAAAKPPVAAAAKPPRKKGNGGGSESRIREVEQPWPTEPSKAEMPASGL